MGQICIIAHDKMKPALVHFLREREPWLWGRQLVATGMTAAFLENELHQLPVEHVHPGREGGFNELRAKAERGELQAVFFFRDPEIVQDYEDEVVQFVKTCIRLNIPLASNPASAELLIVGLIRMEASKKTSTAS